MFIQAVDIQKYNYASIWQKNPLFLHKIQKYMKTVKSHITQLLYAMNEGIFEKEHPIALSLLSAISGESIFFLGPPGVAKSLIARRLKLAFDRSTSFEYLMSRFSTPDEIFGPVSISKLKDEDKYERIIEGYLPSATIVFLDEIWKAGPSIQNSLLTVINEKIYRNGQYTIRLPLKGLIAASNELPAQGEGLEALWDRFLIRCFVGNIEQEFAFDRMIASVNDAEPVIPSGLSITEEQYRDWRTQINQVNIHYTIFELIHSIKRQIEKYNIQKEEIPHSVLYVSDRRWKKIVSLLRTSAFLNGADTIRFSDCTLLLHCLWNEVEQIPVVEQIVSAALRECIDHYLCGERILEQKLNSIREDMKSEHSLREIKDPALQIVDTFYHQIEGYPVAGNLLIFASDYQGLRKDTQKLFYIQRDKYRPVNWILKVYDYVRNRNVSQSAVVSLKKGTRSVFINNQEHPLTCNTGYDIDIPEETYQPFEFRFQELIALCHNRENDLKRITDIELQYCKEHLFMDDKQRSMIKRVLNSQKEMLDICQNEIREIAYTHGLENKEY